MNKPKCYRDFIDRMVHECHEGQGSIGPDRVRAGIWHREARPGHLEDQHRINVLLARLNEEDREVLAQMLADQFEGGVFESLKALEDFGIAPFVEGYEGNAYHDFIGRVDREDPWPWPKDDGAAPC